MAKNIKTTIGWTHYEIQLYSRWEGGDDDDSRWEGGDDDDVIIRAFGVHAAYATWTGTELVDLNATRPADRADLERDLPRLTAALLAACEDPVKS